MNEIIISIVLIYVHYETPSKIIINIYIVERTSKQFNSSI